jgi:hypothetical protein
VPHRQAEELIELMRQDFPFHYARGQFRQSPRECLRSANAQADYHQPLHADFLCYAVL